MSATRQSGVMLSNPASAIPTPQSYEGNLEQS